jgi:hypothetical protein
MDKAGWNHGPWPVKRSSAASKSLRAATLVLECNLDTRRTGSHTIVVQKVVVMRLKIV